MQADQEQELIWSGLDMFFTHVDECVGHSCVEGLAGTGMAGPRNPL